MELGGPGDSEIKDNCEFLTCCTGYIGLSWILDSVPLIDISVLYQCGTALITTAFIWSFFF